MEEDLQEKLEETEEGQTILDKEEIEEKTQPPPSKRRWAWASVICSLVALFFLKSSGSSLLSSLYLVLSLSAVIFGIIAFLKKEDRFLSKAGLIIGVLELLFIWLLYYLWKTGY